VVYSIQRYPRARTTDVYYGTMSLEEEAVPQKSSKERRGVSLSCKRGTVTPLQAVLTARVATGEFSKL
jgi:hypothetical protein